jgi:hypothetical protein
VTDRCSGWTTIVAVPSRAQVFVFTALTHVLTSLPFPVLVLHSDNGSEFINDELRRFCDAHGIRFTPEPFCPRCEVFFKARGVVRSRPYHKNDNCYVESKNWTLVRRCLGYRRFDTKSQLADLQQLETLLAQRANILQPSMALLEKIRIGSKIQKRYHAPVTPLHRLLQAPEVSDQAKARLLRKTSQDLSLKAVTEQTISL